MKYLLLLGLCLFNSFIVSADEGMWTIDQLPEKQLKKSYGFKADSDWTKSVQLSSVRLGNGCSGSFISNQGLVMTNHHCARSCIQQVSSAKNDYISQGFYAQKKGSEKVCPGLEINRLSEILDVTKEINAATKGLTGKEYSEARKAKMSDLEKKCSGGSATVRCDVVSLYRGGQYKLYKYRRYQDVRLVFAPEQGIASFGGDPDNFNFPRYCLDMTFLRVYESGKPIANEHYFKWSNETPQPGDLTFITGHPGSTNRLYTMSQLEYQRDYQLMDRIMKLSEKRGFLTEYQRRGKEQKRTSRDKLKKVENRLKAYKGRLRALQDKEFLAQLESKEKSLKSKIKGNRRKKRKYGSLWKEIDQTLSLAKEKRSEINNIGFNTFDSRLFTIARTLVRAADELKKPNEKRLREFTEAKLPQMKQRLMSPAPIYKELEVGLIEFELTKMREALSPDHPFVKKVLGKRSPAQVAQSLVKGSRLHEIQNRKKLLDGGKKSILSSKDPMIKMALLIDQEARAMRELYENEIQAKIDKSSEKMAQARFDIYGTDIYPDATFSLRVSYGQMKGYTENGKQIPPVTYASGLMTRQTGSAPFKLPRSWEKAKTKVNQTTPFNFVTTNDIIGGNSGSPVLNRKAEIIGLVFDGNIHSLGGAYGFDERLNRAVAVHGSIILESLDKVYGAKRILNEIKTPKGPVTRASSAFGILKKSFL